MKLKQLSALACTFAIFAAHGTAQAGAITFNEQTCISGSVAANSLTCTVNAAGGKQSATMSAWSTATTGTFSSATFGYYSSSGLGILGKNEPDSNSQHAIDNRDGVDAVLINFGSANFALNEVKIGWSTSDSDFSILRYTGTTPPSLTGVTTGNLDNVPGWEWVADYSNLITNSAGKFNNTGDIKTASWWLISAYDPAYSGKNPPAGFGGGNDYFKLSGFGGDIVMPPPPSQVPEPGSFALFGIALIGFAAARRQLRSK